MLASFQDEMEKIAANEATVQDNPRIQDEKNNGDWRQKGPPQKQKQKQDEHSETPASKANAFFGLPMMPPLKRGVRMYEQGSSSASSPDRSQSPVDGQSTANISQGGAQYPATGPGGV